MKVGPGKYQIWVDNHIDAAKSVPLATIDRTGNWGAEIYVGRNSDSVDANDFIVWTGVNGAASDQPFHFLVP